ITIRLIPQRVECLKIICVFCEEASLISCNCSIVVKSFHGRVFSFFGSAVLLNNLLNNPIFCNLNELSLIVLSNLTLTKSQIFNHFLSHFVLRIGVVRLLTSSYCKNRQNNWSLASHQQSQIIKIPL